MKNRMKKSIYIFCIAIGFLFIQNCRQTYEPTDSDLSSFGWTYYEEGDYVNSLDWFLQALVEDPSYYDAYNGVGWTMGRLGQASDAIDYFTSGLQLFSEQETQPFMLDFYAGLAFANNAEGQDAAAELYAETYFFGNLNTAVGDPEWCFCHDKHINQIDVRLIQAISEFRQAKFYESQESVNRAYGDLIYSLTVATSNSSPTGDYLDKDGSGNFNTGDEIFNGQWADANQNGVYDNGEIRNFDEYPLNYDLDIATQDITQWAYLANHLSLLSNYTSIDNGENGLICGCDD